MLVRTISQHIQAALKFNIPVDKVPCNAGCVHYGSLRPRSCQQAQLKTLKGGPCLPTPCGRFQQPEFTASGASPTYRGQRIAVSTQDLTTKTSPKSIKMTKLIHLTGLLMLLPATLAFAVVDYHKGRPGCNSFKNPRDFDDAKALWYEACKKVVPNPPEEPLFSDGGGSMAEGDCRSTKKDNLGNWISVASTVAANLCWTEVPW
ncbi:hypothetical protein IE81DRAFT_220307 [Ceraceosorus guamensis]|uniref:Uncharacterized protein n=1 Tax=Ceraceosorus guamensis TaxID=1522189 RepID=A0A316VSA5_9BASI|nr:hypothetical protein IE81DRAFT_220307 [Ceraceosorus guamensis]PWN40477.1 hypothetical protein IE81DRAFT_220307 [Ceraceosorus guamensis]